MNHTQRTRDSRAFRTDINGLRAWAVVAVILYHFGVPGFDGGFVGVDIFFVISGFLMTSIIVTGLESQKFSILNFYLARAKRILPALLALCATLLVAGWFFLIQIEYKTLAQHIISSLSFTSNNKYWHESGYFDIASYDKWLLHTWSLSVEWQFYLILPLILIASWKVRPDRQNTLVVLSTLTIVSLTASIALSATHPSASFYLLPTRAWEMLLGGIVFLISTRIHIPDFANKYIALIGFALITYSIILTDPSSAWPSWRTLLPAIGTSLVILAKLQTSLATRLVLFQWLGSRSYSLYLWHWPIAAALVYLELRQDIKAITIGLLTTIALGHISYTSLETKSKKILEACSTKKAYLLISVAIIFILAPSKFIVSYEGVPSRQIAINASQIIQDSTVRNPRLKECFVNATKNKVINSQCTYGGNELGAIVIGDSHAASIVRAVERSLPSKKLNVLDWELHSCATILRLKLVTDPKNTCSDFLALAVEKQRSLPANAPIIIVNRWAVYALGPNEPDRQTEASKPTFYINRLHPPKSPELLAELREGIISTACEFAKTRQVYLVRPFPELKISVPLTMARRASIPGSNKRVSISMEEYYQRNEFVWEAQDAASKKCGVKILDPLPYLCSDGKCYGDHNGTPIYVDDDHLNEHGGDLLIPMFSDALRDQGLQKDTYKNRQAASK